MSKLNFPSRLSPEITSSFKLKLTATYLIETSVTNSSKYFCKEKLFQTPYFTYFHSMSSFNCLLLKRKFSREIHYCKMKNDLKLALCIAAFEFQDLSTNY